jgi:translocator protein
MKPLEQSSEILEASTEYGHPIPALVVWLVLILGLGSAAGIFFGPGPWFQSLVKPSWNPPGWLFGPVWTLLYSMMATSVWKLRRVAYQSGAKKTSAMLLFWSQLLLNLAWTPIFFGLQQPAFAFVEICLLWCAALSTALAFGKVSSTAGYLLVPYLMWLSFALVLNGTIWLLNS